MRSGFLIDGSGRIRVDATPPLPAGLLRIAIAHTGAEVAFHPGGVAWLAFTKALRLLAYHRPKRVAMRLLSESNAPIRIFRTVWEFAEHAEALALPPATLAPQTAWASNSATALVSRFSFLRRSVDA